MRESNMTSFLKWNYNLFISSLKKINLSIILIMILDVLFYLFSGFLIIFWLQRIQSKIASFNLPSDIVASGYENIQQLIYEAKIFLFLIIFSLIILLIAIIFFASILKGIIWAKTTNTRISFVLISKFLALNLIWMSFWFVLIFLISFFVQANVVYTFMITVIIISFYFTNTLYSIFVKEQKFKSIISAIKLNITKIQLFLLPYAVISLIFFIIVKLGSLLKFNYSYILVGLLIIIYIAVVRYYISTLVFEFASQYKY